MKNNFKFFWFLAWQTVMSYLKFKKVLSTFDAIPNSKIKKYITQCVHSVPPYLLYVVSGLEECIVI